MLLDTPVCMRPFFQ